MFFTQNPIGSSATEDLQDNAISFDYAMNSPAALWQDRFGKQHKTVQQALKDVGFKPAGFDFVSGGTLGIGDRDKCVFYPTDGYWYSWNGKLPYVVPVNSSPTPGGKKGWKPVIKNSGVIEREALRRTYQEVGLNLVDGSFEKGGVLVSANDVLLHEATGKCYSGNPGTVTPGTLPTSGGFVDKSTSVLRSLFLSELDKPKYQGVSNPNTKAIRGDVWAYRSILAWDSTDIESDKFDQTDTIYYRFPQILKLPSGALIIVVSTMHKSNRDLGQDNAGQYDLTVKWSFNNGVTWENKKTIAQFGPGFQNADATMFYDQARDRVWCFFTSCKGKTGVGFSQAGKTDPDSSSQIYYTYSNGESNAWSVPVNITSLVKPSNAEFFGVSNGKGFAYPDGTLAVPMLTYNAGNQVTIHYMEVKPNTNQFKLWNINTGLTGGEQTLTLLANGTLLSTARGLPLAGKGQQMFFYSHDMGRTWNRDPNTTIQTTEVKGDIAVINDFSLGRPLYVFAAANGVNDNQGDRSNLKIWFSNDLVTWGICPISVYPTNVGYVACIAGIDGDEILLSSEAGGQSGIFFHSCSLNYVRSRGFSKVEKGIRSTNGPNARLLISSGAIPDRDFYFDTTISALCFTNNGARIPVSLFDPVISVTGSVNTLNVDGKSIVQIDGGCFIRGFSGGYVGQRITVLSTGSANLAQLVRLAEGIPASERLFYDLSGAFTALHVVINKQQSVDFIRTPYGWVSGEKANA